MRGKISPVDCRGARERTGKPRGGGERGGKMGLGGKELHGCWRGNCGLQSLNWCHCSVSRRLGGSVWQEQRLWSHIACYAASGSVSRCGGHVIILPSQTVAAKTRKLSPDLT